MAFCANCIDDRAELFPALWDGKHIVLCAGCGGEPIMREEPRRLFDEEEAEVAVRARPKVYGAGRTILEAIDELGGRATVNQVYALLLQRQADLPYRRVQNALHHLSKRRLVRAAERRAGVSGGVYVYERSGVAA